jgi:hypothetical protein
MVGKLCANGCRRKFLSFFPDGYRDDTFVDWEREYKWDAHEGWHARLDTASFRKMLRVKSRLGAEAFATGLFELLHGTGDDRKRFERWA